LALDDYPWFHERHRVFPAVFEGRGHRRILDVAAGLGVVASRISRGYPHELLVGNDITPECLASLRRARLTAASFDLDDPEAAFPFRDGSFDAVVALATIEHLLHTEHFLREIRRCLSERGCLYLSAPNYSGLGYVLPFLVTGKTFHDPLEREQRYEFFGHVRYFTYRSLLDYVTSLGFGAEAVYVPLPEGSARFRRLRGSSALLASAVRLGARVVYTMSARWAAEPVLCFTRGGGPRRPRKVLL
jgi:SAM-dependent methyltransferase